MTKKQPAIYLPHGGGPCFFMDWTLGPADTWDNMEKWLRGLAEDIGTQPDAIIVISAHWETDDQVRVSSGQQPDLIYDYYGFPEHTYKLTYPAPGSPQLANQIAQQLMNNGIKCALDAERGYDHGTFIPLKLIYPQADIPVVQLSLRSDLDPAFHIEIGQALAGFREKNILIIGSGMSYHNLKKMMRGEGAKTESVKFDNWLSDACKLDATQRNDQLTHWRKAPNASDAHPREEHLLPLMVISGSAFQRGQKIFSDEVMGAKVSAFLFS